MVEFFELERLHRYSSVNFVRLDILRNGREILFFLSEGRVARWALLLQLVFRQNRTGGIADGLTFTVFKLQQLSFRGWLHIIVLFVLNIVVRVSRLLNQSLRIHVQLREVLVI